MKLKQKIMAREMRKERGLSLREISESLQVSKSIVSSWVCDIELTPEQKRKFVDAAKKTRQKSIDKIIENTNKRHDDFRKIGYQLAKEDEQFRLLCTLYWAEGWKDRNVFDLANCDISMLQCVSGWLRKNNYSEKATLKIRYYEENKIKESDIIKWWSSNLPFIKRDRITAYAFKIKRETQKKGIGKRMHGVASIIVFDTELIQKIHGGIEYIKVFLGK